MNKLIPLFIVPCTLTLYSSGFSHCIPHVVSQEKSQPVPSAEVGITVNTLEAAASHHQPSSSTVAYSCDIPESSTTTDNYDNSHNAANSHCNINNSSTTGSPDSTDTGIATDNSNSIDNNGADNPASTNSADNDASPDTEIYVYYPSDLIAEINSYRISNGLGTLSESSSLNQAATVRCRELITCMSHTRPDGRSCSTVYGELGIYPSVWGENLAAGYYTSTGVAADWMLSDGHRANILNPAFTKCGVAYITCDAGYGSYWVILFSD